MTPEPADEGRSRGDQGDWRPRPDPTNLTTEQLHREVAVLRELIEEKLGALTALVDSQIERVVRQLDDARHYYDKILIERDRRYDERFEASQTAVKAALSANEKAIDTAFESREKAIAAAFLSSEKAIEAAFVSAEKAINKAEQSIEKRADATYVAIGELQQLLGGLMPRTEAEGRFTAALAAVAEIRKTYDASFATLADRVKGLEARGQGKAESQFDMRAWMVALVAFVGLVVTLVVAFGGRT